MATYTSRKNKYYMWDAVNNYWDGHVNSQPLLNDAVSTDYATSSTDSRWYNTAFTKEVQIKAINSCKDAPTSKDLHGILVQDLHSWITKLYGYLQTIFM